MIKLDVGRDGNVVGLDENAEIWWRMNIKHGNKESRKGDSWATQSNKGQFDAFDVTLCTTGNQFARGLDGKFYTRTNVRYNIGTTDEEDTAMKRGDGWTVMLNSEIQGNAYLTCGLNGDLWTLTTENQLYRRVGVTRHDPAGDSWSLVANTDNMQMIHISLGETGELWMVDSANKVYRRVEMTD
jgi:hypothetical protein